MKPRILVIDDEAGIRDSMRMILEYEGYECLLAATGPEGLQMAEREAPDLVFLDIKMPAMDGIEVLERLRARSDAPPVVMISGHATVSTAVEATRKGAFDFIEKPLASDRVLLTVRHAVDQRRLRDENVTLRRAAEARHEMVGDSPALERVRDAIGKAAPTNATVLILGESGVGKELVARAIHRNSLRARERFVQVNCAAIPEELIESELFGHEKGSFTGATEKQIGKFEQADRGTIFLDEVGDMSAKTQAKVLRVLQEGEVERLGSSKTMKVDVRVIAATNKRLEEEIDAGRFREDLYFRLSVIPIHVPPLRERTPDIPLLVKHFTELFNHESSFKPRRFSNEALVEMQQQRWRGNIRELRNTVERLLIMSRGDAVEAQDIREILRIADRPAIAAAAASAASVVAGAPMSHAAAASEPTAPAAALAPSGTAPAAIEPMPKPGTLREFKEVSERAFLVEKLREFGWNISRTAEMLDTPRSNLYKKLEQHQISQEKDG
jgi:two-component system, NtrC family, nitrogen regulation response regulator NtrX